MLTVAASGLLVEVSGESWEDAVEGKDSGLFRG